MPFCWPTLFVFLIIFICENIEDILICVTWFCSSVHFEIYKRNCYTSICIQRENTDVLYTQNICNANILRWIFISPVTKVIRNLFLIYLYTYILYEQQKTDTNKKEEKLKFCYSVRYCFPLVEICIYPETRKFIYNTLVNYGMFFIRINAHIFCYFHTNDIWLAVCLFFFTISTNSIFAYMYF